jgi:hypothetical protein
MPAGSSLTRHRFPDVLDDLIDLRVAERRTERGHRARLAVLDKVADKVVVKLVAMRSRRALLSCLLAADFADKRLGYCE